MKISVALATYNGEKFIEIQLNSILNQSKMVDEVVISDDFSTDSTIEICRKFIKENNLNNWKIIENEKNVGYCLNFYKAINHCCGDLIFLADQDDEWYFKKIETMSNAMENNSDIYVLSSRYDIIDENSKNISLKIPYLGKVFDGSLEYYNQKDFIGCSCVRGFSICFRKEIKEILKPIDLKSLLSHDWYICFLGTFYGKVAVLNTKLCGYRYHKNNVSLSYINSNKLIADRIRRLKGLYESVEGHTYINSLNPKGECAAKISKFIDFERKRIKFLETKKINLWLNLFLSLKMYNYYYKGNGLRVWIGDFCYAYNINFKKFKTN